MSTLGNNKHGRWTRLVGALNRLESAVKKLDRRNQDWEQWEVDALLDLYPIMTNRELSVLLGRSAASIKVKGGSKGLGMRKAPQAVNRARKQAPNTGHFAPGSTPANEQPVGSVVADVYG